MNKDGYIPVDSSGLYECRMLVFMEEEPYSNRYCQVLLTHDEYAKVSKALASTMKDVDNRDRDWETTGM